MTAEDRIIDRVSKLLAQAEHPNTSDVERDAFLAKADALMAKHMIDEAMLRAAQKPEERRKPVVVNVTGMFDRNSVYGSKMELIAWQIARTVGVKMVTHYKEGRQVTLVGFDEDVRWMQMLFMNVQMAFASKMSPKWDPARPFDLNVAMIRESGLSWRVVLDRAVAAGAVEDTWSSESATEGDWQGRDLDRWVTRQQQARWSAEDKLNRAYRNWCRANDKKPVQVTRHEAYRHTYSEAFTSRICSRLEEMEAARKVPGTELVLRTVEEDILKVMWDAFPGLSPEAKAAREKARREAAEKHAEWLAGLSPAERLRYEKDQTAQRQKDARANDRYWRAQERENERLYDTNGGQAGTAAADSVNLNTNDPMTAHDRKGLS